MAAMHYQRFIVGYHGCDESTAEKVLKDGLDLAHSNNAHDWLGQGTYFWEYAPERALEWARWSKKLHGKINTPSVVGAYINLGHCFDLLDVKNTSALRDVYPMFIKFCRESGKALPINKSASKDHSEDMVLRFLDCAMINWYLDQAKDIGEPFQTVRCAFIEGGAAFKGSKIALKSHIQVAVIDQSCILGYFRPRIDTMP